MRRVGLAVLMLVTAVTIATGEQLQQGKESAGNLGSDYK